MIGLSRLLCPRKIHPHLFQSAFPVGATLWVRDWMHWFPTIYKDTCADYINPDIGVQMNVTLCHLSPYGGACNGDSGKIFIDDSLSIDSELEKYRICDTTTNEYNFIVLGGPMTTKDNVLVGVASWGFQPCGGKNLVNIHIVFFWGFCVEMWTFHLNSVYFMKIEFGLFLCPFSLAILSRWFCSSIFIPWIHQRSHRSIWWLMNWTIMIEMTRWMK